LQNTSVIAGIDRQQQVNVFGHAREATQGHSGTTDDGALNLRRLSRLGQRMMSRWSGGNCVQSSLNFNAM
jgi:hypothetical protein